MGDLHPHLLQDPRFKFLADRPVPDDPPPPPAPTGPPPAFDGDRHKRLKLLVLGCDYRGPRVECSCTAEFRVCLAGRGRRRGGVDYTDVSERDCFECRGG